ncbi:MAG: hypothetical protein IPN98_16850 [Propionivibrio sp.]|nr:hypothetical protein [Propionivibrio sp.]
MIELVLGWRDPTLIFKAVVVAEDAQVDVFTLPRRGKLSACRSLAGSSSNRKTSAIKRRKTASPGLTAFSGQAAAVQIPLRC